MLARAARRTRQLLLWASIAAAVLLVIATPLSHYLGVFVRFNSREILRVANGSIVAHPAKVTLSEPMHLAFEFDRFHASEPYRWGLGITSGVPRGVYVPIWGLAFLAATVATILWRWHLHPHPGTETDLINAKSHPAPIARVLVRLGVLLLPMLVFLWLSSAFYAAWWRTESYASIGIRAGCVTVTSSSAFQSGPGTDRGLWLIPQNSSLTLAPSSSFRSPWWRVTMPLWIIISWALLATTLASMRLRAAERRASGGCTHCGYSRTGLTPATPCPECGKPAEATS